MSHEIAINLMDVSVDFKLGRRRRLRAVNDITLHINTGDIFGLLGPNGAGKSTAMYCMLGLIKPDKGRVQVLGEDAVAGALHCNDMVYLPEEPHYHPYLTVGEALVYYARLYRRQISKSVISEALQRVGLQDFTRMRIARCSKGMKQKVGIATCMLFQPKVMFLDEPTRGLDPMMVRHFRDYLLELRKMGTTIVMNSHVLSEVELVCDRIAIMNRGQVVANAPLHELAQVQDKMYDVAIESTDEAPAFMKASEMLNGLVRGVVPEEKLDELIAYCRQSGNRLYSCQARSETLEDVFMRILGESS